MPKSYEDYEREYEESLSKIRAHLASTRSISTMNECDRLLSSAKSHAHALVGLAEISGDADKIRKANDRLTKELGPLGKEIARGLEEKRSGKSSFGGGGSWEGGVGREGLFKSGIGYEAPGGGRGPSLIDPFFGTQREQSASLDTERLIQNSEDLLRESQSLCAESEQIGESTLQTMGSQREQLNIAHGRVRDTQNTVDQARRLLREMGNRALRNKLFLYCVIALLVCANGAVLYHMFFKSK